MIIYLDIFFIKEMFFNSIIIFLTGKITNQRVKIKRMLLASLLGTIYSVFLLITNYNLTNDFYMNFICAFIINIIAFKNESIKSMTKGVIVFFLVTFILGGANVYVKEHEGNLYVVLPLIMLIIPLIIKSYKKIYKLDSYYGKLFIKEGFEKKELKFFIDTGNSLVTCYDEPVIILSNQYEIKKSANMKNLRSISYKTINEKEICIDGVKVDKVTLEYQNIKYENEAVFIKSNVRFENYDAIVGLEFFENARKLCEKEKEKNNGYFIFDKS